MNADERRFKHSEITEAVIGAFYDVYGELGYGFLEAVYARAMEIVLTARGFLVEREKPILVMFRGQVVGEYALLKPFVDARSRRVAPLQGAWARGRFPGVSSPSLLNPRLLTFSPSGCKAWFQQSKVSTAPT